MSLTMMMLQRRQFSGFGKLSRGLLLQEYFLEGAFRNLHSRLRTHAESVAFFGGGMREGSMVGQQFSMLMAHLRRVIDIRCVTVLSAPHLMRGCSA